MQTYLVECTRKSHGTVLFGQMPIELLSHLSSAPDLPSTRPSHRINNYTAPRKYSHGHPASKVCPVLLTSQHPHRRLEDADLRQDPHREDDHP